MARWGACLGLSPPGLRAPDQGLTGAPAGAGFSFISIVKILEIEHPGFAENILLAGLGTLNMTDAMVAFAAAQAQKPQTLADAVRDRDEARRIVQKFETPLDEVA